MSRSAARLSVAPALTSADASSDRDAIHAPPVAAPETARADCGATPAPTRSDIVPAKLAEDNINGFDYYDKTLAKNLNWIAEAHALKMSTNVWTVNKEEDMRLFIDNGIDAITTNEPLLLRKVLGKKEFRKARRYRK